MPGHNRMVSVTNQDRVSISDRQGHVSLPVPRVKAMVGVATRMIHAVVINFIEIHLVGRIVYVVLVRGVARPVSAGGIHLDDHKLVCREIGA